MLELLPYNWEWKGISQVYHNVTTTVGDIHHFAWRAKHPRWAQYVDEDEARYAHWTAEECSSRSPTAFPGLLTVPSCCIASSRAVICRGGGPPQATIFCNMTFHCANMFPALDHHLSSPMQHAALGALHSKVFQTCQTQIEI